jgi:hypothetical protein
VEETEPSVEFCVLVIGGATGGVKEAIKTTLRLR